MKNIKWILPTIIIALVLGGCPYRSDIPLDSTGKKINTALLGNWHNASKDQFTVTQANDYTYKIVQSAKSGASPTAFKAYIVEVDGTPFLNLQQDGAADKSYFFYKVEINSANNKVTLRSVTENITEKFSSKEEMKEFFQKYKSLSFFYTKSPDVYIKN